MTVTKAKTAYGIELESPQNRSRAASLVAARGFITENFNLGASNATGATMTSGTVYAVAIGVNPGDVINNIYVTVETSGASVTTAQCALHDRLGNRLAVTTDSATTRTALESTGIKTCALTAAYTIPDNTDAVYVSFLYAGSSLKLACSGTTDETVSGLALSGKFAGVAVGATSATSIAATQTLVATNSLYFWAALG